MSFEAEASYSGVASVSGSASGEKSESKAESKQTDTSEASKATEQSNEFYKLWIIDEPRQQIKIDRSMLAPSKSLHEAILMFVDNMQTDAIHAAHKWLFFDF